MALSVIMRGGVVKMTSVGSNALRNTIKLCGNNTTKYIMKIVILLSNVMCYIVTNVR